MQSLPIFDVGLDNLERHSKIIAPAAFVMDVQLGAALEIVLR
jgi:hypothetical protein